MEAKTAAEQVQTNNTAYMVRLLDRRNSYQIGLSSSIYMGTNLALEDGHSRFTEALSTVYLTMTVLYIDDCIFRIKKSKESIIFI